MAAAKTESKKVTTEEDKAPNDVERIRPSDDADEQAQIAELAYLRAESRGFEPGSELDDWLQAEEEVNGKPRRDAKGLDETRPLSH